MLNFRAQAQTGTIKPSLFDGIIVAGYVDKGAYINCTGPNIKYASKPLCIMLGLLPSLKFKEDKSSGNVTKNSLVTPSLGFGLTMAYKHLAIQLPAFYTAKTVSSNGKWNAGIGLGYKF
ncbi:hypothetical protein DJ568_16820 [Mucilaginibacter hurinus]|uniref:Outer membrane protein beta-barrel domain-containing protein n=2 Tax=Mucilaginibacter hurinus TaxID=2201324 RepID=A0A367GJI2_9SPHI|nr:hypothetical protein DJ568_16820 [Mucilaginibacter hurinus]